MTTLLTQALRVKPSLVPDPASAPLRGWRCTRARLERRRGALGSVRRPLDATDYARTLRYLADGRALTMKEALKLVTKCATGFPWYVAQPERGREDNR